MSPIGSPDFGANPATNPTSPSFDSGEDTTRLLMGGGSQARSGRWIFATGFEEGASPYLSTLAFGTGGEVKIINTFTYQGVGSFQLKAGTTLNDYSWLKKSFSFPSSRFGFEFMISRGVIQNCELEVSIYGSGKGEYKNLFRSAKIVIVFVTSPSFSALMYNDINGSRTLIKDVTGYNLSSGQWNYFKMVFDFNDNIFSRMYYNDLTFDLNSPGYESSGATLVDSSVSIQVKNKFAGATPVFYVDNLIITADEP